MERKKTVQELINALKTLRLHEADLTAQLEEAIEERERDNHKRGDTARKAIPLQRPETGQPTNRAFQKGDRIRIRNKVHKPASWDNSVEWVAENAQTATVTEVLTKGPTTQVHFATDNGVNTWRAPNNLRLLA
jgi:hypothetical protein